jgi:hypothetical protein
MERLLAIRDRQVATVSPVAAERGPLQLAAGAEVVAWRLDG